MSRRGSSYDSGVKERSGWLVPSAVLLATAVFCAIFLLYYLAPNPATFIEVHTSPTAQTDSVRLTIGGLVLRIPANYLPYPSDRRGGVRKEVALYASLPDFRGYSVEDSAPFLANGANSPIVHVRVMEEAYELPEAARLSRIYLDHVVDVRGARAPFGLVRYSFRDDSGYRGEDLFVGRGENGILVMRCVRLAVTVSSPNCLREMPLTKGVGVSYRFKRARLAQWHEIARGVARLIASFTARPR